jgi:hypothetical protein
MFMVDIFLSRGLFSYSDQSACKSWRVADSIIGSDHKNGFRASIFSRLEKRYVNREPSDLICN